MAQELVEIARFSSRMEAEVYGHALDQYDIPFLIQGHDVGMFGPGMIGFTPGGVALLVPEESLPEVEEILSCVAAPAETTDEEQQALGESNGPGESGED